MEASLDLGAGLARHDLRARLAHSGSRCDTLGAIARRLGVSISHLKRVNGIKDPRRLQIGQTIAAYKPPA